MVVWQNRKRALQAVGGGGSTKKGLYVPHKRYIEHFLPMCYRTIDATPRDRQATAADHASGGGGLSIPGGRIDRSIPHGLKVTYRPFVRHVEALV